MGILRRFPEIDDSSSYRAEFSERSTAAAAADRDYRSDRWTCAYPHQRSRSSYELRDRGGRADYGYDYADRGTHVREELELDEMYRKRTQHTPTTAERRDRDYAPPPPRTTVVPIRLSDAPADDFRRMHAPRPYHTLRSKSSDYVLEREYTSRGDDSGISDVSHRFFDRDGNFVNRGVRRGYDVDILREYDFARDAQRRSLRGPTRISKSVERHVEELLEYEEKEKRMWIPERRVVVGVQCPSVCLSCILSHLTVVALLIRSSPSCPVGLCRIFPCGL